MSEEKKTVFGKYREIIVYIIVGVMTTIFSWVVNWILTLFMDTSYPVINFLVQSINWCLSVCFAFPLNRKWVFKSTNPKWIGEFLKFSGSRISTWALDVVIMLLFVNVCPLTPVAVWLSGILKKLGKDISVDDANYWFVKLCISSVLVMVFNYIFSKLIVFKKKKTADTESSPVENTPEKNG